MGISSAVEPSRRARVLGIKTTALNLRAGRTVDLPQRIAVFGQGSTLATYPTTKVQVTSAEEVATLFGPGSPIHLAVRELFPVNGDGVGTIPVTIYPLVDDVAAQPASGTIITSGVQAVVKAYRVRINNIDSAVFTILPGDAPTAIHTAIATAINAVLEMPVIATGSLADVTLVTKWAGLSANDVYVEIIGDTTSDTVFAVTQVLGGLVNPDITAALALVGSVWETMVVSCLGIADTTALDLFQSFGEGRYDALVRKPWVVFHGVTLVSVASATVVSSGRNTDRVNCQIPAPGSNDIQFVIAARAVARIAVRANSNPPFDYASLDMASITPGTDGEQWTAIDRDVAIKAGSSSIVVKDGVVNLADTVTMYFPTGDPNPAYAYVVDIVKIQNILYNLGLIFEQPEWDGAPLIPDNQPTTNRSAKKPRMAVAAVAAMVDSLALAAIISDPEAAKATIQAQINAQNPKRLDVVFTLQLSGNVNILSVDFNFGFFFGTDTVVA